MKAIVKDKVVVGIYQLAYKTPEGCLEVALEGRTDIPFIGCVYADSKFSAPETNTTTLVISDIISAALATIDGEAAQVREKYIGTISNQLGVYTAKYQDARAYRLKVYKDNSEYRWLTSEMSATGDTIDVVADRFISKYTVLLDALTRCEELRIFSKNAIRQATNFEEVREIKIEALTELRKL